MRWPAMSSFIEALGSDGRRDILRVLTSSSQVRADVIRQFYDRPDGEHMAELLMLLEEREWARQAMIEELLDQAKASR